MAEIIKKISGSGNSMTIKSCRALPFQQESLKQLRDFGIFEGGIAVLSGTPPFAWNVEKQTREFTIFWFVLKGDICVENGKGDRMEGKRGTLLLRSSAENQRIVSRERASLNIFISSGKRLWLPEFDGNVLVRVQHPTEKLQ